MSRPAAYDVLSLGEVLLRLDPGVSSPLTPERVDRICEAFGNVVDAKSPFTYHHSLGVTEVAEVEMLALASLALEMDDKMLKTELVAVKPVVTEGAVGASVIVYVLLRPCAPLRAVLTELVLIAGTTEEVTVLDPEQ